MSMEVDVEDGLDNIDLNQVIKKTLFKTAIKCKNEYQTNIRKGIGADGFHDHPFVDTGEALNDITVEPQGPAHAFNVGGDVIQLAIAEFGRSPGSAMPPDKPIRRWAHRKGLTPREGQTFDRMVYGIRKSIGRKGIEGFAPARLAAIRTKDKMQRDFKEQVNNEIEAAAESK